MKVNASDQTDHVVPGKTDHVVQVTRLASDQTDHVVPGK